MLPDNLAKRINESTPAQAAHKAHGMVDGVYQKLTAPDRPLEPEPTKKPWLAAFFSLFVPGAGQFYNRQLAKAISLFFLTVVINGILLLVWLLIGWLSGFAAEDSAGRAVGDFLSRAGLAIPVVMGGLWLFALVDAWRTAAALRDGRKVVRYGFLRQSGYMAVGFVPGASFVLPEETVAPEDAHESVGKVAGKRVVKRVVKRLLKRVVQICVLVVGAIPIVIGAYLDWPVLVVAGGLATLAALIAMMD